MLSTSTTAHKARVIHRAEKKTYNTCKRSLSLSLARDNNRRRGRALLYTPRSDVSSPPRENIGMYIRDFTIHGNKVCAASRLVLRFLRPRASEVEAEKKRQRRTRT